MAGRKFTPEEDRIIIDAVKKSPQNINKAFVLIAPKLNRTVDSIRVRYYGRIAKDKDNKLFLTVSERRKLTNYKVQRDDMEAKAERSTKPKWRRILDILFEK